MSDNPATTKRFSYVPEYRYGHIPDANGRWTGEYGLKPWPAHMQPRQIAREGNISSELTAFLAVTPSMRKTLAATCEALIALLDEIDGDENLEDGDEDAQVDDDRCDVPDSGDDEHELGWQEEGSQGRLQFGSDDECDLGTPEQINQVSRLKVKSGLMDHDGEPSLGWTGIATGRRMGETTDDREHDAGDDREVEYDGGAEDFAFDDERNCSIPGGGSVS